MKQKINLKEGGLKHFVVLHKVKMKFPTVVDSFHSRESAEHFIKKTRRRNLSVCMKGILKQKYPEIFYQYYNLD